MRKEKLLVVGLSVALASQSVIGVNASNISLDRKASLESLVDDEDMDFDEDFDEDEDMNFDEDFDEDEDMDFDEDFDEDEDMDFDEDFDEDEDMDFDEDFDEDEDMDFDEDFDEDEDMDFDEDFDEDEDMDFDEDFDEDEDMDFDEDFDEDEDMDSDEDLEEDEDEDMDSDEDFDEDEDMDSDEDLEEDEDEDMDLDVDLEEDEDIDLDEELDVDEENENDSETENNYVGKRIIEVDDSEEDTSRYIGKYQATNENSFLIKDQDGNVLCDLSSPAWDFHLFGDRIELNNHTNGNLATNILCANGQGFGTNQFAADGIKEYNYINVVGIKYNSEENTFDSSPVGVISDSIVVLGKYSDHAITDNGHSISIGAGPNQSQAVSKKTYTEENNSFIDVYSELKKLSQLSAQLAQLPSNTEIEIPSDQNSKMVIDISDSEENCNILTIKAEDLTSWSLLPTVYIKGGEGKTMIINVDMTNANPNVLANLKSEVEGFSNSEEMARNECNVLWNLFLKDDAGNVTTYSESRQNGDFTLEGGGSRRAITHVGSGADYFIGSILAPEARIAYGAINGTVIGNSLYSTGKESHKSNFNGLRYENTIIEDAPETEAKPEKDELVTPEEPVIPDTPATPEEPVIPDTPATPEEPVIPDTPVTPEESVIPDTPMTPEEPEIPNTPVTPEQPVFPDGPATSEKPVVPNTPAVSEKPSTPNTPTASEDFKDQETINPETENPTPSPNNSNVDSKNMNYMNPSSAVQTGDFNNLTGYGVAMLLSLVTLLGVIISLIVRKEN